ncbi:MAG: hypothetical protein ACRDL7_04820, partial [Gaiellaceae bacterium]
MADLPNSHGCSTATFRDADFVLVTASSVGRHHFIRTVNIRNKLIREPVIHGLPLRFNKPYETASHGIRPFRPAFRVKKSRKSHVQRPTISIVEELSIIKAAQQEASRQKEVAKTSYYLLSKKWFHF